MFDAFRLIPALQIIFTNAIEFQDDSFVELTAEQYAALERRGPRPHRIADQSHQNETTLPSVRLVPNAELASSS